MSSFRKERVADLVHASVASHLREMHDPRLQAITVTEVQMTPDLKTARIFFSSLTVQDEKQAKKAAEEAIEALIHSKGILRKHIAKELQLRFTPELYFLFDDSVREGNKIETLLNSIRSTPSEGV